MQIGPRTVVTVEYTLTNDDGEVLDTSVGQEPLAYLHGVGQIIPGLERALTDKTDGDTLQITIPAADAYGERDPELLQAIPRSQFEDVDDLEVGMQLQASGPEGDQLVTVVGIEADEVMLDGNHPLAGLQLHFDVRVVSVREATAEELQHGHPHGPGDHHHH